MIIFQSYSTFHNKVFYDSKKEEDKLDGRLTTIAKDDKKPKYSRENVRQYFFTRFFTYIGNYDKVLKKRFPSAYTVYRVFSVGVKDFYNDMIKYFKINAIQNSTEKGLKALTRKEIELWKKMPGEMMKVAPVLLISALPFANYVVFPLA